MRRWFPNLRNWSIRPIEDTRRSPMLGSAKTAVKYFVYGLIVGLAGDPRSGAETRKEVINWATDAIRSVLSRTSKEVYVARPRSGEREARRFPLAPICDALNKE